ESRVGQQDVGGEDVPEGRARVGLAGLPPGPLPPVVHLEGNLRQVVAGVATPPEPPVPLPVVLDQVVGHAFRFDLVDKGARRFFLSLRRPGALRLATVAAHSAPPVCRAPLQIGSCSTACPVRLTASANGTLMPPPRTRG